MKISTPFYLFTLAILLGLLLPFWIQDGMFLDGVIYATISRNLAVGLGDFFHPYFTPHLYPTFYEHPPLVFGIQSLFFKLFGDSIYVERLYTACTTFGNVFLIIKLWHLFTPLSAYRKQYWVPVFLWISIPAVFWACRNNILENTMSIFTLSAVYFYAKACLKNKWKLLLVGSVFVLLAFLSKGPVGLFPLAVPAIYGLVFWQKEYVLKWISWGILVLLFSLLLGYFLWEVSSGLQQNLSAYWEQQVMAALQEKRVTTANRFSILGKLIIELSFPIVLCLFFIVRDYWKNKKIKINKTQLKSGIFFLLLGISASLPLIVSLKQRKFYLTPSIPFYVLGFSLLLLPYIYPWIVRISQKTIQKLNTIAIVGLALIIVFSISQLGQFSRYEDKLTDIYTLQKNIPKDSSFSTTELHCKDWGLHAYLYRLNFMGLSCTESEAYFLISKEEPSPSDAYKELDIPLRLYRVFQKEK